MQSYILLAGLLGSYFLAMNAYSVLIAPHTDLWPSDYKVISLLLILPAALLVVSRDVLRFRIRRKTKVVNYLLCTSLVALFIAAISEVYFDRHLVSWENEVRPLLWVAFWMAVPLAIVETPRLLTTHKTVANRLRLRVAVLAAPEALASPAALEAMALLCSAFNGRSVGFEGIYTPDKIASKTFYTQGGMNELFRVGQLRPLRRVVLAGFDADTAAQIASELRPLATDVFAYKAGESGSSPSLELIARRPLDSARLTLKAMEDLMLGALFLMIFGPLMAFIAFAIWVDSPGPIFFKQKRHGLRHREIEVFKFRTMRVDKLDYGCAQQTRRGDRRITRIGSFLRKSSLDELPQLLNVIRGEMSLVGPRPHAVNMLTEQRLSHEIVPHYANRHCVKPGITGWAQINGCRGAMDFEEQLVNRVDLDLEYIKKSSIFFDAYILVKTVFHLASPKNAY